MTRRIALLVMFAGPLLVVPVLSKVHASWVADPPYDYTDSFRFAWSIAYIAILIVAAYGLGLPDLPGSRSSAVRASIGASLLAAIAVSIVQLAVGDTLLPRFVVFGSAGLLVGWSLVVAAITRRRLGAAAFRDRVLLISTEAEANRLRAEEALGLGRPWRLVHRLDPSEVTGDAGGASLLGAVEGWTVVVVDSAALRNERVVVEIAAVHEHGRRVRTLVDFYAEWLGKLPASELVRASLFFDIAEVHRPRYGRLKRVMDVTFALIGLLPLVLLTPFVWLLNLLGNRGPLLYRQSRVGLRGEEFTILKFRTMTPATTSTDGGEWTAENDARITPFGRVLRSTHLDELPQLWNVLRGDLTLVGPRPEQPRYVSQLQEQLPFYAMRHLVRPGLTGWAQVCYGYAGDESDALEKLQYEFFYLRHQGIRFDLRILGRTIRSVMGGQGAGR